MSGQEAFRVLPDVAADRAQNHGPAAARPTEQSGDALRWRVEGGVEREFAEDAADTDADRIRVHRFSLAKNFSLKISATPSSPMVRAKPSAAPRQQARAG